MKMINSSDILRFIKDKSVDLSKEEMERIIEEELNKPENEMDADLIEYCLDALNEIESNNTIEIKAERKSDSRDKLINKPFKKILAVAAAVAILAIGSLSVFAAVSDVNILDGLVELYNKYIVVRFDKSDDKADDYEFLGTELAEELKENGIYPILLPEALLSEEAHVTDIEYQVTEFITSANISFVYGKEKGNLMIDKHELQEVIGEAEYPNARSVTTLEINGVSVYVFEQNQKGTITFIDSQTEYTIVSSMTYEQAIEFAKTIK